MFGAPKGLLRRCLGVQTPTHKVFGRLGIMNHLARNHTVLTEAVSRIRSEAQDEMLSLSSAKREESNLVTLQGGPSRQGNFLHGGVKGCCPLEMAENTWLGGGNSNIFYFHPFLGK